MLRSGGAARPACELGLVSVSTHARPHDKARSELSGLLASQGLDVRNDALTRGAYSSDASLYRVTPQAVLFPRSAEEVSMALEACRGHSVPIVARGAGTSVAGNAVGEGLVVDFSRYMNQVLRLDPDMGHAVVQPGVVQQTLQRAAAAHALRFGPDPSTHTRCTIGGMIGNNACGARSLGYGRTSDNVLGLQFLTGGGDLVRASSLPGEDRFLGHPTLGQDLARVMAPNLSVARTEFDTFGRQVSGLAVHHLLPERFDLVQAIVGSEGALALVTEATVRLVKEPLHRLMVVLGFTDIVEAGSAASQVVTLEPTACEGLDSRLVDVLRERKGSGAVPPLPAGRAWLFVELSGDNKDELSDRARRLLALGLGESGEIVADASRAATLWRIREDGAGLAGRAPSGRPAWAGWEDAAVPPAVLGSYLADFDRLVDNFGLTSAPYGHFGEGCVHVRLDFPFDRPEGSKMFREFLLAAAELVGGYGGSISGEHGDGRARSELLPLMYSSEALNLFGQVKQVFDPENLLNPGVLVDPLPLDANIRASGVPRVVQDLAFSFPHDSGDFAAAVHRCTGVGKCRADNTGTGGVMCPSYLATREEKDSTRGRARVLQEMVRGERPDWRSPAVAEALDLCLACKGCASDCPTGIDLATYKSEVLHHRYRRRLRPRAHYTLGWLPRWSRLVRILPVDLVNRVLRMAVVGRVLLWLAGVDHRRAAPRFAPRSFARTIRDRKPRTGEAPAGKVVLFVDSFTNQFRPEAAEATLAVVEGAGYDVEVRTDLCCGLTWISTGQLDGAKRILGRSVRELARSARDGSLIVGIEPSCTAVLRTDARELVPGPDADDVGGAVRTLAELLAATPGWKAPDLSGVQAVAQIHCHQNAVLGFGADERILRATGADVATVSGCCGLAGNFGAERGHFDVSVAVAEANLLPALRQNADAVVLTDGFSCATQVADLAARRGLHLAQFLQIHHEES